MVCNTVNHPSRFVIGRASVSGLLWFSLFFPFVLLPVKLIGIGELLHLLAVFRVYPPTRTHTMDDFDMLNAPNAGNGVGSEEDPAAAFLAQQESEIAGIENDEGFSILDSGEVPSSLGDSNGVWLLWSSGKNVVSIHLCYMTSYLKTYGL